jgi:hypothetical protein
MLCMAWLLLRLQVSLTQAISNVPLLLLLLGVGDIVHWQGQGDVGVWSLG